VRAATDRTDCRKTGSYPADNGVVSDSRTVQKPKWIEIIGEVRRGVRDNLRQCEPVSIRFRSSSSPYPGGMNQHQQHVIYYLVEENRVLREQIGNRRMRFSDDQRRRLAVRAKKIGRRLLGEVATIVTPETLLACAATSRYRAISTASSTTLISAPCPKQRPGFGNS
jgi:hypothetical protein